MKKTVCCSAMIFLVLCAGFAGCANRAQPEFHAEAPVASGTPSDASVGETAKRVAEENGPAVMGAMAASEPTAAANKPTALSASDVSRPEVTGDATLAAIVTSQPDRYLIKNVTLSLEVNEVKATLQKILAIVNRVNGYIADMHESVDSLGRRSATIQARVPYKLFQSVMQEIDAIGKVLDRQVTSQDVTEEYVDATSKLRNLKRTEERLLEHLKRTGKLSEVVLVERELNRVRGEIEQLEGRLRYLSNQVAFSTFTITLQETAKKQALVPPESYSTGKVASDASRELVYFLRAIWSTAVWVGVWAVVWLPVGLIGFVTIRRRMGRTSNST